MYFKTKGGIFTFNIGHEGGREYLEFSMLRILDKVTLVHQSVRDKYMIYIGVSSIMKTPQLSICDVK